MSHKDTVILYMRLYCNITPFSESMPTCYRGSWLIRIWVVDGGLSIVLCPSTSKFRDTDFDTC